MSQKHDEVQSELLASERTYLGRLEVLHDCLLGPLVEHIEAEAARSLGVKVPSDELKMLFQVVTQVKEFTAQVQGSGLG